MALGSRQSGPAAEPAPADAPGPLAARLRPSVANILGSAELLLKTRLDGEQEGYVRTLQRCGAALLALLDGSASQPDERHGAEAGADAGGLVHLAGLRVLVVQDADAERRATRELLSSANAHVTSLDSAKEALAFLGVGHGWDAAVIDADLSGDSSRVLAHRLLAGPDRVGRLVAVLDEETPREHALAWRALGALALARPLPGPALLRALAGSR